MGVQRLFETLSVVFLVYNAVSVSAEDIYGPCLHQPNGAVTADISGPCHSFLMCWNYRPVYLSCQAGYEYDSYAQYCVPSYTCSTGSQNPVFCDYGQYMVYPWDKTQYLQYGAGQVHLRDCPYGLEWDIEACTCIHPNVYGS